MRNLIEQYFELMLEDHGLEEVLEQHDISPLDALMRLYDCGLIDLELYENEYEEE